MTAHRYEGLDALRAVAMLLGVAYHATFAWLPDIAPWYLVADASPVPALVVVTGGLHALRMQLFFALSGFFSHLVFERRGARGFLKDRARRILVPGAVALPLVLGLDVALRTWSHQLGVMASSYAPQTAFRPAPLHLWFLVYLFVFCLLAAWAPAWSGPSKLMRAALRTFPPMLLILAVPTCLGVWLHPENRPDAQLWPMPFELAHFGVFYACGWWLWSAREEAVGLQRWSVPLLVSGLGLAIFVFRGPLQWEPLGHVLSGVVPWLVTLGALGLALRQSTDGARNGTLQFLVESSYWVYLVHYPVVLALQVVCSQLAWPGALEYLLVTVVTLVFSFVTFALFVRRSPLGPWLGVKRAEPS